MPRCDGTLQKFKTTRFKEDTIELIREKMLRALKFMHANQLTHNDITLNNILYKGEYPNIEIYLSDFGKLRKNSKTDHLQECQRDFNRLELVIQQLTDILTRKEIKRDSLQDTSKNSPILYRKIMDKIGKSPEKSQTKSRKGSENTKQSLNVKQLFR
jgi:serine/threonine protein kinase